MEIEIKKGVLAMSTEEYLNIGDYIQGLAPAQFFDNIDLYIERERLGAYNGEECKVIMNGWYMHRPSYWPPSPKIKPLFVAFHITTTVKDRILTDKGIEYLKKHQPIGCRDYFTRDLLLDKGIDAYFSGCMTLTLGEKYLNSENDGNIYSRPRM